VAAVVLASILYNLPRFFERRVVLTSCDGVLVPRTEQTPLRRSRHYFLVYKTLCYFVFRSVGPLVALVVLNGQLVRALRAVRRRRRRLKKPVNSRGATSSSGGGGGAGENLTLMLVTVVTVRLSRSFICPKYSTF